MRRILITVAASLAATLALAACGTDSQGADPGKLDPANPTKLVVGASPVPHTKILEFINDNLAKDAGIAIEIKQFDDYVLPNEALASGDIDANYFQHIPYLENQIEEKGFKFSHSDGIHIEPYALFSNKYSSADEVAEGDTIAITNDPSNQYRGLKLLETAGLLKDITEDTLVVSLTDAQNPKKLAFEELPPEVVVRQLDDPKVAAAIINGNFILTAGLNSKDAILLEAVEGNPYANILVWRTEDAANPAIAKLDELLRSKEVADFIRSEWPAGDVIPGK